MLYTTCPISDSHVMRSISERRFGLPQPALSFDGVRQATTFGAACPQQNVPLNESIFGDFKFPIPANVSEDCMVLFISNFSIGLIRSAGLFVNVVRPVNASNNNLLPVVFVSV